MPLATVLLIQSSICGGSSAHFMWWSWQKIWQNINNCRMHLSIAFDSGRLTGLNRTSTSWCNCFRHVGDLNCLAFYGRTTFVLISLPKYWFTSLFQHALVVAEEKANNLTYFETFLNTWTFYLDTVSRPFISTTHTSTGYAGKFCFSSITVGVLTLR